MSNPFDYINRKRKQQEEMERRESEKRQQREAELRQKEEEREARIAELKEKAASKYYDMVIKLLAQLSQEAFPKFISNGGMSISGGKQSTRWSIYEYWGSSGGDPWSGGGGVESGSSDKVSVELVLDSSYRPTKFIVTRYDFDEKTLFGHRRVKSRTVEARLSRGELVDALKKLFPPV